MKIVTVGGVELQWDDTLTVGELVTAYRPGYHILTSIDHRDGHPPLATYVQVIRPDGTRVKKPGRSDTCDISYVERVDLQRVLDIYRVEHNAAAVKRDNLLEFVPR